MTVGVVAPLVLDPLRAAIALVVILGAVGLLGGGDASDWWIALPGAVTALIGFRTWHAGKRWKQLGKLIDDCRKSANLSSRGSFEAWKEIYDEAREVGLWSAKNFRGYSWAVAFALAAYCLWLLGGGVHSLATLLLVAATASGLNMWCLTRAYRIRASITNSQARSVWTRTISYLPTAWTKGRASPQWSRVLRVVTSVTVLAAAATCGWLSNVVADRKCGVPSDSGMHFAEIVYGRGATWVVGISVSILVFNSLWGWACDTATIALTLLAGAVGGVVQWRLGCPDDGSRNPVVGLLPVVIWLLAVGFAAQYLPHRPLKSGQRNTSYGEKDRPAIMVTATASQNDRHVQIFVGQALEVVLASDCSASNNQWHLEGRYNQDVLRGLGSRYQPDRIPPEGVGTGTYSCRFRAVKAGRATLAFTRPVDAEPKREVESFTFEVTVWARPPESEPDSSNPLNEESQQQNSSSASIGPSAS